MTSAPQSRLPRASERLYRQLLFLYPRPYREAFGHKMARTFTDCCDIAFQENGLGGLIKLWLGTLWDMTSTALEKHVEEGILSSRLTAIRLVSLGAMVGSGLIFATEWDAENMSMLWAALLFTLGGLGLFVTSPWALDIIKRRGTMSATNVQSAMGTRWPQARSIPWAFAALAGLGFVDLLDIVQDGVSGESYIQPMVDRYGPIPAMLVGALPRLVFYLLGLWLYRRGSAWGLVSATTMAIPRILFSFGVIDALLNGTLVRYGDLLGDGAAVLLAFAAVVTGIWVTLERRSIRRKS